MTRNAYIEGKQIPTALVESWIHYASEKGYRATVDGVEELFTKSKTELEAGQVDGHWSCILARWFESIPGFTEAISNDPKLSKVFRQQ
jgi:hypothetical protein